MRIMKAMNFYLVVNQISLKLVPRSLKMSTFGKSHKTKYTICECLNAYLQAPNSQLYLLMYFRISYVMIILFLYRNNNVPSFIFAITSLSMGFIILYEKFKAKNVDNRLKFLIVLFMCIYLYLLFLYISAHLSKIKASI